LGDRVTIEDDHLNIQEDYFVIGVQHRLAGDVSGGEAETGLALLRV
jgi:hypothetical protein